ncbi:hypothetical protein PCK1_000305 [Pneumocystis canis]|nr:hypothetical protein PCK1_000305 [Pneumocystis canis]
MWGTVWDVLKRRKRNESNWDLQVIAESSLNCHWISGNKDYDFPPGTEEVSDVDHQEWTLIPAPTSDIHDPLNWTQKWKWIALMNQFGWLWCANFFINAFGSLYPVLERDFNITTMQVTSFTTVLTLVIGFGNFLTLPWSVKIGRRSMFFFTNIFVIISYVWTAIAKTYGSMMGARVLSGIFAAPIEVTGPMIVSDLFFTHERGYYNGIAYLSLIVSSYISTPVSGAFADTIGWRKFYWLGSGTMILSQIFILFTMPETKYNRTITQVIVNPKGMHDKSQQDPEDSKDNDDLEKPKVQDLTEVWGLGRPSWKQWRLWNSPDKSVSIWELLSTPIIINMWPAVLYASLAFTSSAGLLLSIGFIQSQVFSVPPYNFSAMQVGMTNLGFVFGGVLGTLFAGWLNDIILKYKTKKNNGIREAEMRLYDVLPWTLVGLIGAYIFAVGVSRGWHWFIVCVLGLFICGSGMSALQTVAVTYTIDCYKPFSSQIALTSCLWKNFWVFGVGYFINNLTATRGTVISVTMLSIPVFMTVLATLIMIVYGKSFRRWSSTHQLIKKAQIY